MKSIALIAWKEFSDRLRSGWVIACALVWLGAISLASLFGLLQVGSIGVQGYERTVVTLLNLVQYLVPLLGLLLGHDLVIAEREERTLALMLAGGMSRVRLVAGKYFGGCLTLALPLVLGFAVAGTVIGLSAGYAGFGPFLKLAISGLGLGFIFVGLGLLLSALSRSRVQALVLALLAWCVAVFVFDLAAMGVTVITHSSHAAREVEHATAATHVNAAAEMHAAFEAGDDAAARARALAPQRLAPWLLLNPVTLFRTLNLGAGLVPPVPFVPAALSVMFWLTGSLAAAGWKLNRLDL